jgi:hypothetical protein
MAGLDPAIHDFATHEKGVDAWVKPGHDSCGIALTPIHGLQFAGA